MPPLLTQATRATHHSSKCREKSGQLHPSCLQALKTPRKGENWLEGSTQRNRRPSSCRVPLTRSFEVRKRSRSRPGIVSWTRNKRARGPPCSVQSLHPEALTRQAPTGSAKRSNSHLDQAWVTAVACLQVDWPPTCLLWQQRSGIHSLSRRSRIFRISLATIGRIHCWLLPTTICIRSQKSDGAAVTTRTPPRKTRRRRRRRQPNEKSRHQAGRPSYGAAWHGRTQSVHWTGTLASAARCAISAARTRSSRIQPLASTLPCFTQGCQ